MLVVDTRRLLAVSILVSNWLSMLAMLTEMVPCIGLTNCVGLFRRKRIVRVLM